MNTINYQPTGIYPQFSLQGPQNPANTALNAQKNDTLEINSNDKKTKPDSVKKLLIGGAVAASVLGVLHYKKGVGAINKKLDFLKEKGVQTLEEWTQSAPRGEDELKVAKEIFEKAGKYENGLVGKAHSVFQKVGKFFQDNFYSY